MLYICSSCNLSLKISCFSPYTPCAIIPWVSSNEQNSCYLCNWKWRCAPSWTHSLEPCDEGTAISRLCTPAALQEKNLKTTNLFFGGQQKDKIECLWRIQLACPPCIYELQTRLCSLTLDKTCGTILELFIGTIGWQEGFSSQKLRSPAFLVEFCFELQFFRLLSS